MINKLNLKTLKIMKKINLFSVLMAVVCAFLGIVDSSAMIAAFPVATDDTTPNPTATNGVDGVGKHYNGALDTDLARRESPELIDDPIDRVVTKMYRSAVEIDQILRSIGYVNQNGMRFSYFAVDTREVETEVSATTQTSTTSQVAIKVQNPRIFDPTDIVRVKGVKGFNADGTQSELSLNLYVVEVGTDQITVQAVNGKPLAGTVGGMEVPAIAQGTILYRLGHAASEGDMQTAPYNALPLPTENYMQIFKTQTMQSSIAIESDKKVDWKPSDNEELAIYNLRKEIEATYLFGVKGYFRNHSTMRYVYTTAGILQQLIENGGALIQFGEGAGTEDDDLAKLDDNALIDIMNQVFIGNSGSNERYMWAGSGLLAALAKIPNIQRQMDANQTERKFGIKFKTIEYLSFSLLVKMHPLLDEYGFSNCFFVLDMPLIKKHVFRSMTKDILNLKQAGLYDGDSAVWTEISAPAVRYPKCHAFGCPKAFEL